MARKFSNYNSTEKYYYMFTLPHDKNANANTNLSPSNYTYVYEKHFTI